METGTNNFGRNVEKVANGGKAEVFGRQVEKVTNWSMEQIFEVKMMDSEITEWNKKEKLR